MSSDSMKTVPLDFSEALKQGSLTPIEQDVLFGTVTPEALEPQENDGLGEQNINDIREFTKLTQEEINKRFAHLLPND